MESDAVKIGPNVRYFGNKRDIHLLSETSTPRVMPEASLRRIMMARMVRPVIKEVKKKMSFFDPAD
jgi:hypothetical protein